MNNQLIKTGTKAKFEQIRNGKVIDSWYEDNTAPTEALTFEAGLIAGKATQITSWFIALYSGNYTGQATDTAATFATNATEYTGYSEATRQLWDVNTPINTPTANNTGKEAIFTCVTPGTIYGCATLSVQSKGSTAAGILLAIIRFGTARSLLEGDQLKIQSGLTVASNS